MHNSTRLLLVAGVLLPVTAGCKVQPVDGNIDRRQPVAAESLASTLKSGGGTIDTLGHGDSVTVGGGTAGGVNTGAGGLGPAAREAVKFLPLGYAGDDPGARARGDAPYEDIVPHPDRWRVGFPAWERGSMTDSPWDLGAWWDPYHQNVLKGDYPLPGTQNLFLSLEASAVLKYETKKLPIPSGGFPRDAGNDTFFGSSHLHAIEETLFITADLFHGETSFKPVDWRVLIKGAFNKNYVATQENGVLYADASAGRTRTDDHATLQQAFFETTIASVSPKYDVIQARLGIQQFNSDFRGFMFCDDTLGARFFGNYDDNKWQWNLGWFPRLEKDTNSGLNTLHKNGQNVYVANVYRQDALAALLPKWKDANWSHGLTTQVSIHHLDSNASVHYDENDILVRPRIVGSLVPGESNLTWLGWTNDGHIDRINVTSALYHASGTQDFDEIAGRKVDVEGNLAALELSIDRDWMRFRVQGLWQSGDDKPQDGTAKGFDAIFDNENFAGGEFGFWNRQGIGLAGTGVGLVQGGSLYNTLRSSKLEGSPAFVNPGLLLLGAGWDAQLTPKMKLIANASHLWFDDTASLEYVLGQGKLHRAIGWDLSAGVIWRPLLTDNVIVKTGVSALLPSRGFEDIYTDDTLYAGFLELVLTW
ncbi:MAG: hypothetical protein K8T90_04785 [Planctomycetes bacterium]|nr:hypothetical protein [Planctomycetota bacterium]